MIGYVQAPDDGDWKQKDPKIGDQVGDVGEVAKRDQVEAFARDGGIPELGDWPAFERQHDGDGQDP